MSTTPLRAALAGAAITFAASSSVPAGELVKYTINNTNYSIPETLANQPGDPERGRAVAIDRKRGNCLACHQMPIPEQPFHGKIGPPLFGVGSRYTADQLRLRIVNPKLVNPMSIMPAFYKADGFERVTDKFEGKTILNGQEIEDIIAYLQTLK